MKSMEKMSELKIIIINHHERVQPRVQQEFDALKKASYRITILNWKRDGAMSTRKRARYDYIQLRAPKGRLRLVFYIPLLYLKLIRRLRSLDIDILHCTHLLLLPVCLFLSKRRGTKVVYDAYEMYAIVFAGYIPIPPVTKLIKRGLEFIENKLVTRADYVLTINSRNGFLEKRYRRFNHNVEVLYNVPQLDVTLNPQRLKNVKKQYREKRVIIYVGGIMERKGLIKALESIKSVKEKISNVKLLFIGSLKDSKRLAKEYIERHGLVDNVEFIDWLPYEKMLCYLEVAEIGLALHQPVDYYKVAGKGQGRKFFTYMQASLPIIGPEFGELGQVVREEKCGILLDTTDPQQIANAIMYLLDHPEKAKAMGERGRKAIEEKYNWEIEKEKLLLAYKKLEHKVNKQQV